MNNKFLIVSLYALLNVCVVKNAFAQTYLSPQASGMGNAGRAMIGTTQAVFMNPALLSFINKNHIHLFHQNDDFNGSEQTKFGVYGLDTTTSQLFPGALSYTQMSRDLVGGDFDANTIELALGRREYEKLSFGMAIKRFEWDYLQSSDEAYDGNIGILYTPLKVLGLSFVTYNVLEDEKDYLPRKYAIGTYWVKDEMLRFAVDLSYQDENNLSRHIDVMSGVSIDLGSIDLLFGYANMSITNEEFFTSGFVWDGPRLSVAYGYQKGSKETETHNLDIGVFF